MIYSFIEPRKKELFDNITKLWVLFILFVVILLLAFNLMIKFKINSLDSATQEYIKKSFKADKNSKQIRDKISFLNKEKAIAEEIYSSNIILRNSIKNLFDLVPDQITLTKVIMKKNSLILYGITSSKEAFNLLLGSPLKSIFQSSNTIFYLDENGWYRFVSNNKIIDNEESF